MKSNGEPSLIQLLRAKAFRSTAHLLDLIEYWHYIHSILLPKIKQRYISTFGKLETELEALSVVANEIDSNLELLYRRSAIGKPASHSAIMFLSFANQTKFNSHLKSFDFNRQYNSCYCNKINEIKPMYYALVKKLHPDTSKNVAMFNRFWHILLKAYKSSDLFVITKLYIAFCYEFTLFYENEEKEEKYLIDRIDKLEAAIDEIKKKIQTLNSEEPLLYIRKLNDSKWIEQKRRELIDKILLLKRKIKMQQRTYSNFKSRF